MVMTSGHLYYNFYPRSPRWERPATVSANWDCQILFLSTLPARGATEQPGRVQDPLQDFYPRSPRGERRCVSSA